MEKLLVNYLTSKKTGQKFENGLPLESNGTLTQNGTDDQIHNDLTKTKPDLWEDFWRHYAKKDNYLSFSNNENGDNDGPNLNSKKDNLEQDIANDNTQKQIPIQIQNQNKNSYYSKFSSAKLKNINLNPHKAQIMGKKKTKEEESIETIKNQQGDFNPSAYKQQYHDNIVLLEIMKQNLVKQTSETFLRENILKVIDKPSTKEEIVEKGKNALPDFWQYYIKKYPQNAEK
ncbi:hypothetical protein M0813_09561 [Anaeramoeba flamelloides]|uniref:Uncharacterized protein n=1 Tax=Anaeramoeba flamelloides TaxID=1746091 RepID=A0ABQ8X7Q5_9EUKA|nr:hypothetical protein M0813_09561 [Anaeramoeba flamelloides]